MFFSLFTGGVRYRLSFFFSSRRRHTRWPRDWSSDVCSSDLPGPGLPDDRHELPRGDPGGDIREGGRGLAGEAPADTVEGHGRRSIARHLGAHGTDLPFRIRDENVKVTRQLRTRVTHSNARCASVPPRARAPRPAV